MPGPVSFVQVDAFTNRPFSGNPAAVCVLDDPGDDGWYQAVAAEMNLSETAFLVPAGDVWSLRWFTPVAEVDLCGHATLASAHVLWTTGRAAGTLRFATRSGELRADRHGSAIRLNFPVVPTAPCPPDPGVVEGLGLEKVAVGWTGTAGPDWLVELGDRRAVADVHPDFPVLGRVPCRGIIVTAADGPGIVCRVFAPRVGIDEDPVTGSVHCALGPYWAPRLGPRISSEQISTRGGRMDVEVLGERVALTGQAVTVLEGTILA